MVLRSRDTEKTDLDLIRQSILDTVAAGHEVVVTVGECWDLGIPLDRVEGVRVQKISTVSLDEVKDEQ